MKILRSLAIAAALSATPAFAADTIDFETDDTNTATTANDAIDPTDYDALGVTFTDAFFRECGGGCPDPDFGKFVSSVDFRSPFSITFAGTSNGFGFSNVSNSGGTASAFGIGGNLLRTITFSSFPGSFSFTEAGIKSVTFESTSQFGVDDFTFAAGGVPEPATWGLMILGFGVVGGAMRRRAGATRVAYA